MFLTNHSSAFFLHDVRVVKNVACLSSLIKEQLLYHFTPIGWTNGPVLFRKILLRGD